MGSTDEAQPRKHDRASALVRRPAGGQIDNVNRTAVRQKSITKKEKRRRQIPLVYARWSE